MNREKFERITKEINDVLAKSEVTNIECLAICGQMATHFIEMQREKEELLEFFVKQLRKSILEG